MKTIYYLVAAIMLFAGCDQLNADKDSSNNSEKVSVAGIASDYQKDSFFQKVYFSKADAELILGETAYLSDSTSAIHHDTAEIKLAYTANALDSASGKKGVIYFMIEEYSEVADAHHAYDAIKVANEKHEGIKTLHDVGDEAYFHTDGENFYFILARKGKIMFRIKVNKITSHTSLIEFNRVSGNIADSL